MKKDALFLEAAIERCGFDSLSQLAEALGYSLRTLRGVKYGEVKLSDLMRDAIERLVAMRSKLPIFVSPLSDLDATPEVQSLHGRPSMHQPTTVNDSLGGTPESRQRFLAACKKTGLSPEAALEALTAAFAEHVETSKGVFMPIRIADPKQGFPVPSQAPTSTAVSGVPAQGAIPPPPDQQRQKKSKPKGVSRP